MNFVGTETECAELIAELDASLGYPRGYTQADVDSGLVRFYGPGPHPPVESLRTETVAAVVPVEVVLDERGEVVLDDEGKPKPASDERRAKLPGHLLRDEHRLRVAKRRVLRVLNRGSREALVALPGIGPARADAIIARRAQGRLTNLEDIRDALGPVAMKALRDYALTRVGDADETLAALVAGKAKP